MNRKVRNRLHGCRRAERQILVPVFLFGDSLLVVIPGDAPGNDVDVFAALVQAARCRED
ncbi:MAG TPA: hypothetical protein VF432_09915 [Thermoanaerobaculia bacterium]